MQKQKYLTFGIEADSYKAAKTRLERIELDLLNNFRKLGVQAKASTAKHAGADARHLSHGYAGAVPL